MFGGNNDSLGVKQPVIAVDVMFGRWRAEDDLISGGVMVSQPLMFFDVGLSGQTDLQE